ncbi:MAG TPA: malto-oligosyltrehalose trehalohydrolase [Thermoleophilia bacterium]|nr:malto-oligosyltrehalose trehalohydrolase [Thermoleophilia bacterium]
MTTMASTTARLGATPLSHDRCRFEVWAPYADRLEVRLLGEDDRSFDLPARLPGLFVGTVESAPPGISYVYRLDGREEHADPASLSQPAGVHGPSRVVDARDFVWHDEAWRGVRLADMVIYELHIGTFTTAGTFAAAAEQMPRLRELGVTAVEPMPIAQFPGVRNWGYDGVFPFAAQDSYGGPEGFAAFVDACHATGMAVVLDVVYNHMGPEGGVHGAFGPYFTDAYRTPWGQAVNFDGPGSDQVRRYFIENAQSWLERFHVDALRLDAIHGIYDRSADPFLQELASAVDALAAGQGRHLFAIAESALNDPRVVRDPDHGGFGIHAQWSDDLHHSLHSYLTGDRDGYYVDYGSLTDVGTAYREGFVLNGRYSRFHDRHYGASSQGVPAKRLVVSAQNHDQVGNRRGSKRLAADSSIEDLKLMAGAIMLSPYIPLIFMGEEYGETAPFPYFVSHSDPDLVEAVRRGRRRELAATDGDIHCPDPSDEATFLSARLDRSVLEEESAEGERARLLEGYYRHLLDLRRTLPALHATKDGMVVLLDEPAQAAMLLRRASEGAAFVIFAFGRQTHDLRVPAGVGHSTLCLDSAAPDWGGPGSTLPPACVAGDILTLNPRSAAVYAASGGRA